MKNKTLQVTGKSGTVLEPEEQLYLEKEYNRIILANSNDAVIITDADGRITRFNTEAKKLTGFGRQQAERSFFQEVITVIDSVTDKPLDSPFKLLIELRETIKFEKDVYIMNTSGIRIPIQANASLVLDSNKNITGMVFVFRAALKCSDLTKRITMRETYDDLTGLYNRARFKLKLEELVRDAAQHQKQHALLYLDIDKFKVINDTCGHQAGDSLLKEVAAVIKNCIRTSDLVARLCSDEFGVLLVHCPLKKADELAVSICSAVRKMHFIWKDNPFTIGVSIGVVGLKSSYVSAEKILSVADGSCYIAKEKGGNRAHLHVDDDRELSQLHGEMRTLSLITKALDHNMFRLFYQPIVPCADRTTADVNWYEILIRMIDNKSKIIPPVNFLQAAERYDLMPAIDRWVFSAFFSFYHDRLSAVIDPDKFICDINVSGMTLNDESFYSFIKDIFRDYNVPPQTICFEITETAAIANFNQTIRFIDEMKDIGCRFSLDDFGSGLSSFKYLKHLPVDYLKIDGSFVKHIMTNSFDAAIVSSINEIGHLIGIKTVAEFVETKEIFDKLQEIGVDSVQGYWISMPKPIEESI
jgi:diguanylate cyclase (GGDEF)-like protein/PAS domain S-box-containing protein